jgi:Rrf2 family nitric oxide-sensitive transcriptional repressor
MKLTRYTDYALRVLLHLAAHQDRLCSIAEIARAYGISESHLMKVVHDLGKGGFVATIRGRGGGLRLGRPAETIGVGEVVRYAEDGFDLVDCKACIIAPLCRLSGVLCEAMTAFLAVLDRHSLADLASGPRGEGLRDLFVRQASVSSPVSP